MQNAVVSSQFATAEVEDFCTQLKLAIELVVPETLTYSYCDLAQLLDDANAEMKKHAGMLSLMLPRAKALTFQFRSGGKRRR